MDISGPKGVIRVVDKVSCQPLTAAQRFVLDARLSTAWDFETGERSGWKFARAEETDWSVDLPGPGHVQAILSTEDTLFDRMYSVKLVQNKKLVAAACQVCSEPLEGFRSLKMENAILLVYINENMAAPLENTEPSRGSLQTLV